MYRSIRFVRATVVLDYGKDFQLHRRMLQRYFSKDKSLGHRDIQTRESRLVVHNLMASAPERRQEFLMRCICDCIPHADVLTRFGTCRYATAIIIEVVYGHRIVTDNDPYLKIANDALHYAIPSASVRGGSVVDLFPIRTPLLG
jgi:hypothetical protein